MTGKRVSGDLKRKLRIGLVAFLIGWIFAAFVLGTTLSLNPILIAAVVLGVILVLKILGHADALYIVIGVVIGALVSLLVPTASPKFLDPGLMFIGLLVMAITV
jgi:hypothetical protein